MSQAIQSAPPAIHALLSRGIHRHAPVEFISDAAVGPGNCVSGYTFAEYLSARGLSDSQEARRAWRAGR